MRFTLAICLSLVLSSVVHGQAGKNDPEQVIKRMIDTGFSDGHDQKIIGRLGDTGAVLVTKILAGRDITPNAIENALVVVEGSFADPSLVEATGDRQPRTAMFVLKHLDLSTNDVALKKRIADTTKHVQDRYAASLSASGR